MTTKAWKAYVLGGAQKVKHKKPVRCSFCPNVEMRQRERAVNRCHDCRLKLMSDWHSLNKDKRDAGKWCRDHKEERRITMAEWRRRNRKKLKRYARKYWREASERRKKLLAAVDAICGCGSIHTAPQRERVLRRMLPATAHDIREAWSCIWGAPSESSSAGEKKLYRDLKRIDAVRVGGTFYPFQEARSAA